MEVSKAQQREGRMKQVGVFGSSFLLSNLIFLFSARKQANSAIRILGAALPLGMVPCGISGWRLGEHVNQTKQQQQAVCVCVLAGIALGVGLYKRRARLANPFDSKPASSVANYLPLTISFGSGGLGLGYAARRYVDDGFGLGGAPIAYQCYFGLLVGVLLGLTVGSFFGDLVDESLEHWLARKWFPRVEWVQQWARSLEVLWTSSLVACRSSSSWGTVSASWFVCGRLFHQGTVVARNGSGLELLGNSSLKQRVVGAVLFAQDGGMERKRNKR